MLHAKRNGKPGTFTRAAWEGMGKEKNGWELTGESGETQNPKIEKYKTLMENGKRLAKEGNYEEALGILREAQKINNPKYLVKLIGKCMDELEIDPKSDSISDFEKFVLEGKESIANSEWEAAAVSIEMALSIKPEDAECTSLIDQCTSELEKV